MMKSKGTESKTKQLTKAIRAINAKLRERSLAHVKNFSDREPHAKKLLKLIDGLPQQTTLRLIEEWLREEYRDQDEVLTLLAALACCNQAQAAALVLGWMNAELVEAALRSSGFSDPKLVWRADVVCDWVLPLVPHDSTLTALTAALKATVDRALVKA